MDVRSLFDKAYLYAYDLQGRDVTVTIVKVVGGTLTGSGGKSNKKPIIFFKGKEKGLALNITNARTIAAMYGNSFKAEDWIGKRITLYPSKTDFGPQKDLDCIRIRPTIPGAKVKDTPIDEVAPERQPGEDDDESAAS
jgi:hypothetical protein